MASAEKLVQFQSTDSGRRRLAEMLMFLQRAASDQEQLYLGTAEEKIALPESVRELLREAIAMELEHGDVMLVSRDIDLTTQEAADLLNMSRQHLVDLLEAGEIPHHKVGTHRRLRLVDVLRYRDERRTTQHESLDDLARMSFDEGMYHLHPTVE